MKKLLICVVVAAVLATGTFAAFEKVNTYNNNFSDVQESNWFYANVKSAYELGFMNGKTETTFDPNGNVTVAEGITMAARVHAINAGVEIKKAEKPAAGAADEIVFDFNEALDGVNLKLNHAVGDAEDGILVMQPDAPNAGGNFDLGVYLNNLEVDASVYTALTVRMKREALENINERRETFEIFFGSEANPTLGAAGNYKYQTLSDVNMDDWFEYTFDLTTSEGWAGTIVQMRFDPTNNNGIYYIDWLKLSGAPAAAAEPKEEKWYDMYVDYAVANGLVKKNAFDSYTRNATRAEVATLFAAAVPADNYKAINNIKGIPDVDKNASYAKALLMLYNAGVVLGSDAAGTFNPASDIKRSEVAAIIERVALPEKRQQKDTITAVWEAEAPKEEPKEEPKNDAPVAVPGAPAEPSPFDVEFDSEADLEKVQGGEAESTEVVDGALVLIPKDRGENRTPQYDPRFLMNNLTLDASEYTKLQMRMKIDFPEGVTSYTMDIYYLTADDEAFSEAKSNHPNLLDVSKIDEEGYYVVEIDLSAKDSWNGEIVSMRIDPSNNNGVYTLDYIRFAK